jgi:hypothetical protein
VLPQIARALQDCNEPQQTHKETKAKTLFQIAELVRQGGLGLVQGSRCARQ